jgi:hypothetical protein
MGAVELWAGEPALAERLHQLEWTADRIGRQLAAERSSRRPVSAPPQEAATVAREQETPPQVPQRELDEALRTIVHRATQLLAGNRLDPGARESMESIARVARRAQTLLARRARAADAVPERSTPP